MTQKGTRVHRLHYVTYIAQTRLTTNNWSRIEYLIPSGNIMVPV